MSTKLYKVYKIYNDINDIIYVGITSQESTNRLYGTSSSTHEGRANSGSDHPMYQDIRKYGIDKFHMEDLTGYEYLRSDALCKETEFIQKFISEGYELYNIDKVSGDTARAKYFENLSNMTEDERVSYINSKLNSSDAIRKRGDTRRGVDQPNIRGKSHGRSKPVLDTLSGDILYGTGEVYRLLLSEGTEISYRVVEGLVLNGYLSKRNADKYPGLLDRFVKIEK